MASLPLLTSTSACHELARFHAGPASDASDVGARDTAGDAPIDLDLDAAVDGQDVGGPADVSPPCMVLGFSDMTNSGIGTQFNGSWLVQAGGVLSGQVKGTRTSFAELRGAPPHPSLSQWLNSGNVTVSAVVEVNGAYDGAGVAMHPRSLDSASFIACGHYKSGFEIVCTLNKCPRRTSALPTTLPTSIRIEMQLRSSAGTLAIDCWIYDATIGGLGAPLGQLSSSTSAPEMLAPWLAPSLFIDKVNLGADANFDEAQVCGP